MKRCTKCGLEKILAEFYKNLDGLRPDCKACVRSRVLFAHYANHEEAKARSRRYHKDNRDRLMLQQRAYYRRNRKRLIAAAVQWSKDNKQRAYSYQHNWRAASRAGGKHTAEEISAMYAAQNGRCANCKIDLYSRFHRDHIMPLKLGGTNDIGNIQLLCPSCNTSKGAKHPEEFNKRGANVHSDQDLRLISHSF
jgi:5-methylcytosine-specific restriction endonuclease McrA